MPCYKTNECVFVSLHVWENECHDLCIFVPPEACARWPQCVCVWLLAQEFACLFLHKPVFVFVFLPVSTLLYMLCVLSVCVCCLRPSACVELFYHGSLHCRDMHHEYLYTVCSCSHTGEVSVTRPRAKALLFQGSCVCVCVVLTGPLIEGRCKEEGVWWCAQTQEKKM